MSKQVLGDGKNLLWHPFDDSRGLYDPNAKERGLYRLPIASFDHNITPCILYIALNLCGNGFWGIENLLYPRAPRDEILVYWFRLGVCRYDVCNQGDAVSISKFWTRASVILDGWVLFKQRPLTKLTWVCWLK